jgi:excisionase family DNA binding protein
LWTVPEIMLGRLTCGETSLADRQGVTITLAHEYLTVHEAAAIHRVSVPTIYRRCADGRLAHIRVGGGDGPIRVLASAVIPRNPA